MLAMAGMYLAGAPTFESYATGTIIVVAVAVVGSLTVLPALLSWLGDRVEKGGVPIIRRCRGTRARVGLWARVLNPVLRHPVVSGVAPAACSSCSRFLRSACTSRFRPDRLPQNLAVVKTYNKIQATFPGGAIRRSSWSARDDVSSPAVARAIGALRAQAAANPLFKQPTTLKVNPARTVAEVDIPSSATATTSLQRGAGRASKHRGPRDRRQAFPTRQPA